MSEVIYARIPAELKEAVEVYAAGRGTTLTAALADLLERGLESVSNAASVAQLQQRLSELSADHQKSEMLVQLLQQRDQTWQLRDQQWSSAYAALAERTQQRIGTCPNAKCAKPITGSDLLVTGRCPNCSTALMSLIDSEGQHRANLDHTEFAVLMGALGLLVGTALQSVQKHMEKGGEME